MTSIHKKWTKKNCVGKCFNFCVGMDGDCVLQIKNFFLKNV